MKRKVTLKIVYSAMFLALGLVLPFLTMQIQQIGKMLSPMHIPVLLCGFICGAPYGAVVGFILPVLRSFMFGMPMLYPDAVVMTFELMAYGFLAGMLYKMLPKKIPYIYVSLIVSMLGGRIVWGGVKYIVLGITNTEFPFSMFVAGAFTNAIPGIILHIVLIPIIVIALRKHIKNINE